MRSGCYRLNKYGTRYHNDVEFTTLRVRRNKLYTGTRAHVTQSLRVFSHLRGRSRVYYTIVYVFRSRIFFFSERQKKKKGKRKKKQ